MKKKIFMGVIIGLFSLFITAYAYVSIENFFIKSLDIIDENLDEKAIIIFEETIEDDSIYGKYLLNDGTIYSYNYKYKEVDSFEDKLTLIEDSKGNKIEKIKKKDKGYLNMFNPKLKNKYFKRTVSKSDRPSKYIYYVDYNKSRFITIISSGTEVYKNKSFTSARVISILKKYSIRVD
ncbi:MAG: hypothetical protein IKZ96_02565 [Bacilli bacterium]|nr:hypothetical protein [Bacilli bacterium]